MINNFNLKYLYKRSLREMGYKGRENIEEPAIVFKPADNVMQIPYKLNSYGYRCEEFDNQKIMILGCSQTFGDGLPLENTWPHLLSKKINKDYINLAKGGDGIQSQVIKAFQFFKEFHNPDYIFGIFPLFRLEMPSISNVFTVKDVNSPTEIIPVIFENDELEKFSKMPHSPNEVIPKEVCIFYNLMFIDMLDKYCQSNNIKFIWTLWKDAQLPDENYKTIFNNISSKNFVINQDLFFQNIFSKQLDCHLEHTGNILFDVAADQKQDSSGHWGIHINLHTADFMYSEFCKGEYK